MIMTNEEKAINILQQFGIIAKDFEDERRNVVIEYCKNHADYNMLLEMAKWKDAQYSEWIADIMACPPCQLSGIDDEMCLNTDCETYCGTKECNDTNCWKRYFEYKMRQANEE